MKFKIKIGIQEAIFALLLVGLNDPIKNFFYWIWEGIAASPNWLSGDFTKSSIRMASRKDENIYEELFLTLFIALFFIFVIQFIAQLVRDWKRNKTELEIFKGKIEPAEEVKEEKEPVKEKILKSKASEAKFQLILGILMWCFSLLGFMYFSAFKLSGKAYYTKFQKDIEIIGPYVSDQELKVYNSQWRLMKTKADYNKIYEGIDSTLKANNIKIK